MTTSPIPPLLAKYADLLATLGEETPIGAFALIVPPDGAPVEILLLGSATDNKSFYKHLVERIAESGAEQQWGGYVGVGGRR